MRSRWGIIILLSVVIAGCTRDAGVQPFEPVAPSGDVTTPDEQPTATDISITVEGAEAQAAQTEDATPTDEPTDEPPTEAADTDVPTETDLPVLEVTDTPTTAPTNTPRPSPTTRPSPTETEEEAEMSTMADETEEAMGGEATGEEEDFTPGGSGLVPPDVVTNTPLPTSTPLPTPEGEAPGEVDEEDATPEDAEGVAVGDPCVYVVRAGDNAFRIAVNNNVTLNELVEANSSLTGSNPILQPGQELVIPGCESEGIGDEEMVEATDDAPTPPPEGFETYTITSGDTLVAIARRYNTTVNAIVEANDLANPNRLSIGQELLIPIEAAGN